jgi:ribosomal protein S18 acetylase RimI-like enzyme
MTMLEIRPYQSADLESVRRLIGELQAYERQLETEVAEPTQAFTADYVAHLLKDVEEKHGHMLVAVTNNHIGGMVAGYVGKDSSSTEEHFYIAELVVSASYRGQGIGSDLMRTIEKLARADGFKKMRIGVLAANPRVHQLYKRLGFRDYAIELVKELYDR